MVKSFCANMMVGSDSSFMPFFSLLRYKPAMAGHFIIMQCFGIHYRSKYGNLYRVQGL